MLKQFFASKLFKYEWVLTVACSGVFFVVYVLTRDAAFAAFAPAALAAAFTPAALAAAFTPAAFTAFAAFAPALAAPVLVLAVLVAVLAAEELKISKFAAVCSVLVMAGALYGIFYGIVYAIVRLA